jgi:lipopolysaccharide heptosyltransferase II
VRFSGKSVLERKERVWIRLPNWLGDIVMAIPLILALRKGRPDFEVTLLVKERYKDFLEQFGFAENIIGLPQVPGIQYFAKLWQWRLRYPETHIVFTNSFRGDLESWVIGAPQRMGIQRQRALRRFLLTDVWNVPNSLQENTIHQTRLWELWFQHFGLKEPIDLSPIIPLGQKNLRSEKRKIGLICGTENSPLKRWPIAHWISLIERILQKFPNGEIVLLGTKNDWSLTRPIIDHFRHENIPLSDLVGQTNLVAFTHALLSCSCVVSNDTGGMHLSNMLGTPTIAIFGLTNPLRTGPIFGTHTTIIQPPTCPPHGGGNVGDVAVETVFREVETLYL